MTTFIARIVRLHRTVTLGRSDRAAAAILELPLDRLLFAQFLMALLIGCNLAVCNAPRFTWLAFLANSPVQVFSFPVMLAGVTIFWGFIFSMLTGIPREGRSKIYALFFGSSLFLAPSIIPILGLALFPVLFIGWPFVLTRFLAQHLRQQPGRVFFGLATPPLALWLLAQAAFLLAGHLLTGSASPRG